MVQEDGPSGAMQLRAELVRRPLGAAWRFAGVCWGDWGRRDGAPGWGSKMCLRGGSWACQRTGSVRCRCGNASKRRFQLLESPDGMELTQALPKASSPALLSAAQPHQAHTLAPTILVPSISFQPPYSSQAVSAHFGPSLHIPLMPPAPGQPFHLLVPSFNSHKFRESSALAPIRSHVATMSLLGGLVVLFSVLI